MAERLRRANLEAYSPAFMEVDTDDLSHMQCMLTDGNLEQEDTHPMNEFHVTHPKDALFKDFKSTTHVDHASSSDSDSGLEIIPFL